MTGISKNECRKCKYDYGMSTEKLSLPRTRALNFA